MALSGAARGVSCGRSEQAGAGSRTNSKRCFPTPPTSFSAFQSSSCSPRRICRPPYSEERDSVRRTLSQAYDLREIQLLGSDYTKATKRDSAVSVEEASRAGGVDEERYRHLAGSLRPIAGRRLENGQPLNGRPEPLVGIGVPLH